MAAEVAATAEKKVKYAQALLDLVKAFDRIPQWLLVREAIALGYPLEATPFVDRSVQAQQGYPIGGVVSHSVVALRGITAGSGFATAEMRLIMIRAVDAAIKLFPRVNPTLFVDDLAADMTGPTNHVVDQLGGFIEEVALFIKDTNQELSSTKSLCTASHKEVGELLCKRWAAKGISIEYKERVKALGAGLGAGVRRNMTVLRERYHKYRQRIPKFRRLRKIGVDTARLVRTGIRAMTYGSAITGVPNGLLRKPETDSCGHHSAGSWDWWSELGLGSDDCGWRQNWKSRPSIRRAWATHRGMVHGRLGRLGELDSDAAHDRPC